MRGLNERVKKFLFGKKLKYIKHKTGISFNQMPTKLGIPKNKVRKSVTYYNKIIRNFNIGWYWDDYDVFKKANEEYPNGA